MKLFKLLWDLHKWVGIGASFLVLTVSVSGFLLLLKKDLAWVQPPTMRDATPEGRPFLAPDELFQRLFALGRPDLRTIEDIDRIDFRPGKAVYKVRLESDHQEIQVGARSGEILSQDKRWSDWLEALHDGSLFGDWAHDWLMPLFATCLLFLMVSGLYLWLVPLLSKRRRRLRIEAKA